jgi:hypothetical protein
MLSLILVVGIVAVLKLTQKLSWRSAAFVAMSYAMTGLLLTIFLPTSSALASSDLYQTITLNGYRLSLRDHYVDELDSSSKYFGIIEQVDCTMSQTIIINHGGIAKTFEITNQADCLALQNHTGAVWIQYSDNKITDFDLL